MQTHPIGVTGVDCAADAIVTQTLVDLAIAIVVDPVGAYVSYTWISQWLRVVAVTVDVGEPIEIVVHRPGSGN